MITERDLNYESDNLLDYYAGPIKFEISGINQTISIKTSTKWNFLLLDCLDIVKNAWNIKNDDILSQTENEIVIKYDINIISLYIEYSIIFL